MSNGGQGPRARVVRIIARLNVGGPSWHVVLLTAGTRQTFPTTLAVGSVGAGERDMAAIAEARGVPLTRIRGLGREPTLLGDLGALWALWRLLRRERPSIVHTHTAKAGTLGRIAALLAGVPIRVHTFHGHVFHGYFGRLRTWLYLTIERVLARVTTRVIAISPRQARELRGYLGLDPEKIVVVPLGLDLERYAKGDEAAARQRFRAQVQAGDRTVVTMVGRLTAIKNHALAFRGLAEARKQQPELLLVLVGGGEDEDALRQLARDLGLEDAVRFAGWWDDLEAVYYGSDIVALTSSNEGTPVCLIEALACGRPVIATSVGGVPDVLAEGKRGTLVPPDDVGALAQGLVRLASATAPDLREIQGAVLREYGSQRLVGDIEALYGELLDQRNVSRS